MTWGDWTDARVKRLKELYGKGATFSVIAADLGRPFTRSSVSAKVRRLDLPKRGKRQAGTDAKKREVKSKAAAKPTPVKAPPPPPAPLRRIVCKKVSITELRQDHCRWPSGDPRDPYSFRYCGAQVRPGRSYCPKHCEVAFVPNVARIRRTA
jgi:GcrA cell cycle regulator